MEAPNNIMGTKWNSPCGERNYTVISVVRDADGVQRLGMTIELLDGSLKRNIQFVTYGELTEVCSEVK